MKSRNDAIGKATPSKTGASSVGCRFRGNQAVLGATFSGEPRHRRRLEKVLAIETAEQG